MNEKERRVEREKVKGRKKEKGLKSFLGIIH